MKATINIPKGFSRLKTGQSLKDGDYQLICEDSGFPWFSWFKLKGLDTDAKAKSYYFVIRRITRKTPLQTLRGVLMPKGYAQLKTGTLILEGDLVWKAFRKGFRKGKWEPTKNADKKFPCFVGDSYSNVGEYIRAKK